MKISNSQKRAFYEHLLEYVTPHKQELFEQVIQERTRHLTVVLEDIYQSHNASACLRSCDCFGVQDAHIIENYNQYKLNPGITRGSTRWLTLHRYNKGSTNTLDCLNALKHQGYQIVATSPHAGESQLEEYDVTRKTALVFGAEKEGVSQVIRDQADGFLRIPMFGFTESFNISVSVALCLHHLAHALRKSDVEWKLSEEEQFEIKYAWVRKAARKWVPQLEKQFLSDQTE